MAERIEEHRPLTEHRLVRTTFVDGMQVSVRNGLARFLFWNTVTTADVDSPIERRITTRVVMPISAAKVMLRELRKQMSEDGH